MLPLMIAAPETDAALRPQGNDPLLELLGATASSDLSSTQALSNLCSLYASSSDIRGCLRLIHPSYLGLLSAVSLLDTQSAQLPAQHGAAGDSASYALRDSKDNAHAHASSASSHVIFTHPHTGAPTVQLHSGAFLVQLLSSQTTAGSAVMLSDILHGSREEGWASPADICSMESGTLQTLLSLTQQGSGQVDSHAELLSAIRSLSRYSEQGKVASLVRAIVDAIMDGSTDNVPQLLSLLAQLLEQYEADSLDTLSSLESLRRFTRHIIKLLSKPSPGITAPALHILTRLLLHPRGAGGGSKPTPLSVLADGLRGKLFDDAHIGRTLVLVSDLCLNCQAADPHSSGDAALVSDDLRVLNAIAGVVNAVVTSDDGVSKRFSQSTEMAAAVDHVVSMAKLDRRYVVPLLRTVNPILAHAAYRGSPLVLALTSAHEGNHSNASNETQQGTAAAADATSIVAEIFDIVLSGIEDAAYTVPQFAANAGSKQQQSSEDAAVDRPESSAWPRVSSDESGCGWFVNCSDGVRQHVVEFLVAALSLPETPESAYWADDLMQVVSQALDPIVSTAGAEGAGDKGEGRDPFHIVRDPGSGSAEASIASFAQPAKVQSIYARYRYTTASYYWVAKPVIHTAAGLASKCEVFRRQWDKWLDQGALLSVGKWASDVCQRTIENPQDLLAHAMYRDIYDIFAEQQILPSAVNEKQQQQQQQKHVAPSVATPSESEHSSNPQSPRESPPVHRQVIAIDEMRVAAAANAADGRVTNGAEGLGISASSHDLGRSDASTVGLLQIALLRQWARSCEAELAATLVASASTASDTQMSQLSSIRQLVRQARALVSPEPSTRTRPDSASLHLLLGGIRTPAALQRKHAMELLSTRTMFQQRLQQEREDLLDAEEEIGDLRTELQHLQSEHARQAAELQQKQSNIDRLLAEHGSLESTHTDLQTKCQRALEDAREWKEECMKTRDHLEESESLGRETRQQLLQMAEKQQEMQDAFGVRQGKWEERHAGMGEDIRRLEAALGEAVARVRELEAQAESERRANEELRAQKAAMASRLGEYSKIADSLHTLSRMPHH
ncbi:hypothetical protein GQ54DRAFT_296224 [Martensiomyces pterosporus]|nr:hypothetical protein GQ54DRAFT_296224 [Martensiomyces pterosporus]